MKFDEDQYLSTAAMLEKVVDLSPDDYDALCTLKQIYASLHAKEGMVRTCHRLAEIYIQSDQKEKAVAELEELLAVFPEAAETRKRLADIKGEEAADAPEEKEEEETPAPPREKIEVIPLPEMEAVEEVPAAARAEEEALVEPVAAAAARAEEAAPADAEPVSGKEKDNEGKHVEELHQALVSTAVLSEDVFREILRKKPRDRTLIEHILEEGPAPEEEIIDNLATWSNVPLLPLDCYDLNHEPDTSIPTALCERHCLLLFDKVGNTNLVTMADPTDEEAKTALHNVLSGHVVFFISPARQIRQALEDMKKTQ